MPKLVNGKHLHPEKFRTEADETVVSNNEKCKVSAVVSLYSHHLRRSRKQRHFFGVDISLATCDFIDCALCGAKMSQACEDEKFVFFLYELNDIIANEYMRSSIGVDYGKIASPFTSIGANEGLAIERDFGVLSLTKILYFLDGELFCVVRYDIVYQGMVGRSPRVACGYFAFDESGTR